MSFRAELRRRPREPDEYYDNQAYKDRFLRTQMLALVLTLGGVMTLMSVTLILPAHVELNRPRAADAVPQAGVGNLSTVSSITVSCARGSTP